MNLPPLRVRYARWYDRLLALVVPARRRRLRFVAEVVARQDHVLEQEQELLRRDMLLYGCAYTMDGHRVAPERVVVHWRDRP